MKHSRLTARLRGGRRSPQRYQQFLKSVGLELLHRGQHMPQLARRKALAVEPNEVSLGQIGQVPALIFPERHPCVGEFSEVVHRVVRRPLPSLRECYAQSDANRLLARPHYGGSRVGATSARCRSNPEAGRSHLRPGHGLRNGLGANRARHEDADTNRISDTRRLPSRVDKSRL